MSAGQSISCTTGLRTAARSAFWRSSIDFTRECLALRIDYSLGSTDVIREFEQIAFERELPKTIRFDNGAEFTSHAMLRWAAERVVELHFIAPGKPTQNGSIESLNGKIRDELFNMHRFTTIFEARPRARKFDRTRRSDTRRQRSSQKRSKSTHAHSCQLPEMATSGHLHRSCQSFNLESFRGLHDHPVTP
jgi:transposase InsO family protein